MGFGEQYAWSDRVHLRLGEQLYYYVVDIRPYKHFEVQRKFRDLIQRQGLGGIRVFSIFGRHDLLVRAWLHPQTANEFPGWLKEISPGAVNAYPFVVTEPVFRWTTPGDRHSSRKEPPEVLRLLNRISNINAIQSVQGDEDQQLLQKLLDCKLIYEHRHAESHNRIQFFVAVLFENLTNEHEEALVNAIHKLITENHPKIDRFTLDLGFGFCTLLCKGVVKVEDYFTITTFLREIARLIPGITTETLLVNEVDLVAGSERIGRSTFLAIEGKDLTALQVIPELYGPEGESLERSKKQEIVQIVQNLDLSDDEQDFVHDYLLGVIKDEPKEEFKSLAMFFMDLEYFLRENYREFCGRLARQAGADLRRVLEGASVDDSKKHLNLGELLNIYSSAMKISGLPKFKPLAGGWEKLAQVRNAVVHGASSFFEDWKPPLQVVLDQLPRIRKLRNYVAEESQ